MVLPLVVGLSFEEGQVVDGSGLAQRQPPLVQVVQVDALPHITGRQPLLVDGPGDCGYNLGHSGVGGFGCLSLRGRGRDSTRFSLDGDPHAVGIAVAIT